MPQHFSGVHWMLATPFDQNEEIDTESLARLVAKAREAGCEGVVTLGVTGEAARLTDKERSLVIKTVVGAAKGLPVTVGTTANGTKSAIDYTREAQQLGAAAAMIAPPQLGKPNLDAVFAHYQRVTQTVDMPIVVQDYPQTSGVNMPPAFIARLASELRNVDHLKLEDPPTPTKITAIKKLTGDKLAIFGGLGGMFLLDELKRGGAGAMTGFAYPEVLVKICRHMAEGDTAKADKLFNQHLPLILFEFQEAIGIGIRKYALHHRGLIRHPRVRRPGSDISEECKQEFLHLVKELGL